MDLDGAKRRKLHGALKSAFSRSELKQLVSFELNQNLDEITVPGDLSDVILELIQ